MEKMIWMIGCLLKLIMWEQVGIVVLAMDALRLLPLV
jgi:hypothetical protein